jgi:hypothetical protein
MFKKYLIAVFVVFIVSSFLDWLANGVILMSLFSQSSELWRPIEEMKWGLGYVVSFLSILFFTYIYYRLIDRKSVANGIMYGLIYGIAWGLSYGYGTYAYMPIPYLLALGWFLQSVIAFTIFGLIIGLIIREKSA